MSADFHPAVKESDGRFHSLKGMPELNFSNSNCCAIVSALGFTYRDGGSETIPIQDFIDACERFFNSEIAEFIDSGLEPREFKLENHATIMDCGRRAGYLEEKISLCWHSAKLGQSRGATHCYFF